MSSFNLQCNLVGLGESRIFFTSEELRHRLDILLKITARSGRIPVNIKLNTPTSRSAGGRAKLTI